ncbi:hypothetical protein CAP36_02340 [Chitinophagaceae bacterium IBVUCB2]|nr:hypothetical protein CAP36_02340 [Chitinophagaceae bacterium IBVUCB2]
MKHLILISTLLAILFTGCKKTTVDETTGANPTTFVSATNETDTVTYTPFDGKYITSSKYILIDASRDGGVWWFPQTGAFSAVAHHQGKALADYLRSIGYKVHELPRGAAITTELLNKYSYIIRAGGFGHYTTNEIAAYESFLSRSSSLLLLQDHLANFPNDPLSARLGINFEGVVSGTINSFQPHSITEGVTSFNYLVGSVIKNPDPSKMTILGSLSSTNNGTTSLMGAMGILIHPTSRIFFIGDINGFEAVQQPFTSNLVKWLFS